MGGEITLYEDRDDEIYIDASGDLMLKGRALSSCRHDLSRYCLMLQGDVVGFYEKLGAALRERGLPEKETAVDLTGLVPAVAAPVDPDWQRDQMLFSIAMERMRLQPLEPAPLVGKFANELVAELFPKAGA